MNIKTIDHFDGEYRFLSNFADIPLFFRGHRFLNAESAFQGQKCPQRVGEFENLAPSEAKRLGRKVTMRTDWHIVRDFVMHEVVYEKFAQNPGAYEMLKATGDATLIEGNAWNDKYWGVCNGQGENHLGIILMEVRREMAEKRKNLLPNDEGYAYGKKAAAKAVVAAAEIGYDMPILREVGLPDVNVLRGIANTFTKSGHKRFAWLPQYGQNAEYFAQLKTLGWKVSDTVRVPAYKYDNGTIYCQGYLLEAMF